MRIYCSIIVFVITLLVVVLCVLISIIQYYYLNYNFYKKVNNFAPVFEDLIATDNERNPALGLNAIEAYSDDNILNNLNALLEALPVKPATNVGNTFQFEIKHSNFEVFNIIQAAIGFKLAGKDQKALKLFEHASALAPNNPDVLNWYGEFLEQIRHDVVTADELYFKVKQTFFLNRLILCLNKAVTRAFVRVFF